MKKVFYTIILALSIPFFTVAQSNNGPANDDPELDERVRVLAQQLRCLVCQNETLADSQAMLANDLKLQIREQMKAGKSDQEILAYLTARYGDFVLYRPPIKKTTYLLWFGPFVLLAGGLFLLFRYIKTRREQIQEEPLSARDHQRVRELLESESEKEIA